MSPQAGWLLQQEIVPRLKSAIPVAVICVGCEDAAELVQDATAFAAKLLHSVDKAGKKVTPGNSSATRNDFRSEFGNTEIELPGRSGLGF